MSAELLWVFALLVLLVGVYLLVGAAARGRNRPERSRSASIDAPPEEGARRSLVALRPPSTEGDASERPAALTEDVAALPPATDADSGGLPGTPREEPPAPRVRPAAPAIVLRRPVPTRFPLVFAHGWMGFDSIGVRGLRREYFRGVRTRLEALGYTVYFARVSPTAGVERRAVQLAQQLQRLQAERVNIVAHSMGGLDARYAISRLGLHTRVASLTTIGTPHRGTPLADSTASLLSDFLGVRRALSLVGTDGFYDVTTRRMNDFNRAVVDVAGVTYASVVGAVTPGAANVHAVLAPGYAYLLRKAGANDGIVPAESQPWGDVIGEIQADHWAQIGWSGGFDAQAFYARLAEDLARRGL